MDQRPQRSTAVPPPPQGLPKMPPKQGGGEIVSLGAGADAKGIEVKISYNQRTKETTVFVWKDAVHRTKTFASNRFQFHLADSVKALNFADEMAAEIEKELKL